MPTSNDSFYPKQGSSNVFEDLGLANAADLQLKAELTRQLCNRIKSFGLSQAAADKKLGIKQPDVSKLMNVRFTGFSTERLLSLLTARDFDAEIILHPHKFPENRRTVRVMAKVA